MKAELHFFVKFDDKCIEFDDFLVGPTAGNVVGCSSQQLGIQVYLIRKVKLLRKRVKCNLVKQRFGKTVICVLDCHRHFSRIQRSHLL